jgi:NTE family protein
VLQADLVFEGGGVKGIGLAGAYRALFDHGYEPQCVAGTSAGAITAALVAVGYSGAELEDIVLHQMQFQRFADPTFLSHFGAAGDVLEFLKDRGMHSGKYFCGWLREHLQAKGKITFGDLRDPTASGARQHRLQVIASDLSAHSMLVLPRDAGQLGLDPDELEIAQAVRMSMSIPVFFEPVVIRVSTSGADHVIVDGGLLSNYPVWLFDAAAGTRPQFPTFGMLLVSPHQADPLMPTPPQQAVLAPARSPIDFARAIVETMMQAHDRIYVEQANYARTIPIPTLGVTTTEFDISPGKAQQLFDSGKQAAEDFLRTWDFDAYIRKFRSGPPPSRRSTVVGPGG